MNQAASSSLSSSALRILAARMSALHWTIKQPEITTTSSHVDASIHRHTLVRIKMVTRRTPTTVRVDEYLPGRRARKQDTLNQRL